MPYEVSLSLPINDGYQDISRRIETDVVMRRANRVYESKGFRTLIWTFYAMGDARMLADRLRDAYPEYLVVGV